MKASTKPKQDPFSFLEKLTSIQKIDRLPIFNELGKLLAQDPMKVQRRILKKIINENKNTLYGEKYRFTSIKTIEEYQKQVPIITFPEIKHYIEDIKKGKQNILSKEKVIYFAVTSGTTSEPKYIPITKKRIKLFIKQILLLARLGTIQNFKGLQGKSLGLAGTDYIGKTSGNIPYGNISGYLAHNIPKYIKQRMAIPIEVYRLNNYEERTRAIALLALQQNITQLIFAEPIEAILFFEYLKEHKEKLLFELKLFGKKKLYKKLQSKPFIPVKLWPNLHTISCFKSSFNQEYLKTLKQKIGRKTITIRDPGIYSSEGGITLGLSGKGATSIPQYNNLFFEFLNTKKGGMPVTIDKLEQGETYQIIITTPEGLYRYNIEDEIKVIGFKRKIPLLEFVGRNKTLDIAGEKCPEGEIINAMKQTLKKLKIKEKSFTIYPEITNKKEKPKYGILIEGKTTITKTQAKQIANTFDKILQEQVLDYENMRNEYGRLEEPIIHILKKGSYDKFEKKRIIQTGQPKILYVIKKPQIKNEFEIEYSV